MSEPKKNFVKGCSRKQRIPLIYDTTRKCFDGERYFQATKTEINEWSVIKSYESKYIPIKKEDDKTFEQCFIEFKERADRLKKQSKYKINLYKTGTFQKTILHLFFSFCNKNNIYAENLTQEEMNWFIACNHGQLNYNEHKKGEFHSCDVNSLYSSCLKSVHFKIPIKQGTFKKLTKSEFENMFNTYFVYGIYRVRIHDNGDLKTKKMFRFSKKDFYTSTDLNVAKRIGLTMTLIEDDHDNLLTYGAGTCITGSQLFKEIVDYLYNLRTETKNGDFKMLLNLLWGCLCENTKRTFQFDTERELNFDIDIDTTKYTILSQCFVKDSILKIVFCKKDNYFKYNFIRLKPFLLAFTRQTVGRIIEPHLDHIVKIQTDGFYSTKQLNIEIGTNIGEVRYEGLKVL